MNFFEETWKSSLQQTKFIHGKFNMNHPKNLKKCLVAYKVSGNFSNSHSGNTDHVCLSYETAISIEIHKICIIYWFETNSELYLSRQINLECLWLSSKKVKTSTRKSTALFQWYVKQKINFSFKKILSNHI